MRELELLKDASSRCRLHPGPRSPPPTPTRCAIPRPLIARAGTQPHVSAHTTTCSTVPTVERTAPRDIGTYVGALSAKRRSVSLTASEV